MKKFDVLRRKMFFFCSKRIEMWVDAELGKVRRIEKWTAESIKCLPGSQTGREVDGQGRRRVISCNQFLH